MSTIERLAAAEAAATAAKDALDELERPKFATSPELILRRDAHYIAEQNLTALRHQLDAELKAHEAREAAEQGARKQLDGTARKLETSRAALAGAVEQARAALDAVHRQAEAHAALVDRSRSELFALGMKGEVRPDGQPYTTAVQYDAVVINGHRWIRFEPAEVLAHALRRGALADRNLFDRLRGLDGLRGPSIAAALSSGD